MNDSLSKLLKTDSNIFYLHGAGFSTPLLTMTVFDKSITLYDNKKLHLKEIEKCLYSTKKPGWLSNFKIQTTMSINLEDLTVTICTYIPFLWFFSQPYELYITV